LVRSFFFACLAWFSLGVSVSAQSVPLPDSPAQYRAAGDSARWQGRDGQASGTVPRQVPIRAQVGPYETIYPATAPQSPSSVRGGELPLSVQPAPVRGGVPSLPENILAMRPEMPANVASQEAKDRRAA